jgi:hypothetical protein
MREKLNENPMMQVALIGVLLVLAGVFFMSSMGGKGGEEEAESATVSATAESSSEAPAGLDAALAMVSQASRSARPVPHDVLEAWNDNKTVVLLFVHDGGIDDKMVKDATERLGSLPAARTFVIPASEISRYAAVTEGVGVNRVPALVVVRPKHVHQTIPTASVNYGFQSGQSVVQAVIDAGYKGPTLAYHP